MTKHYARKPVLENILQNLIFLEEVFGDRSDDEIPDIPFLELAGSFELKPLASPRPPPPKN